MTIEIKPLVAAQRRAASDAFRIALLAGPLDDTAFPKSEDSWEASDSYAAWDGPTCVGHVGAFRLDTTVVGGARLPTCGVTRVGVLPTHTRRGLLSGMINALLLDARRERGDVLASLRASETAIYGRFGFGLAGDYRFAQIDPQRARPLRGSMADGAMHLLRPEDVMDVVPALYDRIGRTRVGSVSRPDFLFKRFLTDASSRAEGPRGAGHFIAVLLPPDVRLPADDGERRSVMAAQALGYVHYTTRWDDSFAESIGGVGQLHEAYGVTPAAERTLWKYVLGLDLIRRWRTDDRPVDDPIRRCFADYRAYEAKETSDEQWVRVLDVDAAVVARTYGPARGRVVIEVIDPLFTENCGRWAVTSEGAVRTDDAADIVAPIAGFSAAFMGGVPWSLLAATDEITVHGNADATLTVADALFAVHPAPFSGTHF